MSKKFRRGLGDIKTRKLDLDYDISKLDFKSKIAKKLSRKLDGKIDANIELELKKDLIDFNKLRRRKGKSELPDVKSYLESKRKKSGSIAESIKRTQKNIEIELLDQIDSGKFKIPKKFTDKLDSKSKLRIEEGLTNLKDKKARLTLKAKEFFKKHPEFAIVLALAATGATFGITLGIYMAATGKSEQEALNDITMAGGEAVEEGITGIVDGTIKGVKYGSDAVIKGADAVTNPFFKALGIDFESFKTIIYVVIGIVVFIFLFRLGYYLYTLSKGNTTLKIKTTNKSYDNNYDNFDDSYNNYDNEY